MVTPCYYPVKGGTETVVRNLSIELNKKNVHTDVMTFNMDKKWNPKWQGNIEIIDGITIFKIPALKCLPNSYRINMGVNLIPGKFMNFFKHYNIIHFHEAEFSFPLFSFFVRKPKILHLHGIDVHYYRRYYLSKIILKNVVNYYISISKQMKKDLVKLGFSEDKIIDLPNGVDTNLFQPKGEKEDNLLLFVGRITFDKGLHILLESLGHINTPIRLVIIGPVDWSNKDNRCILNQIEQENQKGKHEIIYLGALDQTEIIRWYQRAAIFILPSFKEGLPMVILESLACETPVIATPVGGIPEVVRDYENGILVPINNAVKLAEAIQYLLDNKVRTRLGILGRKLIIENYSLKVTVTKLCRIYEKIINS